MDMERIRLAFKDITMDRDIYRGQKVNMEVTAMLVQLNFQRNRQRKTEGIRMEIRTMLSMFGDAILTATIPMTLLIQVPGSSVWRFRV